MSPKDSTPQTFKPRGIGKKIALVCAGGCITCSILSLGLSFWSWMSYGKHVYTGSLFATTFFFLTTAIVFYEMSRPQTLLPTDKSN